MRPTYKAFIDEVTGETRKSLSFQPEIVLAIRAATQQAGNAATTASNTGASLGAQANQIGGTITPLLEREAENPEGYDPNQLNQMLTYALGGAGGATSSLEGTGALEAARTRNPAAFQATLGDISRGRQQAAASSSEGVAAQSAQLGQQKQQQALSQLQGLYGTDTSGMLESMGLVPKDLEAEADANKTGWFQNMTGLIGSLGQLGGGVGAAAKGILS